MDKHFLFPNTLNKDFRLVRAASFSELSKSKKIIVQQIHSRTDGNLIKQYSCEQIFDQKLNTSHCKVSYEVLQSGKCEQSTISQNITPSRYICTNSSKLDDVETLSLENLSVSSKDYDLSAMDSSKLILAAPKLIFDSKLKKTVTNHQTNFHNYKEIELNKEELSDSTFKFNKPLRPVTRSNTLKINSLLQDKVITDNNKNSNHLFEVDQKNIFKFQKKHNSEISHLKNFRSDMIFRKSSLMFTIFFPIIVGCLIFLNSTDVCDPHFNVDKIPQELTKSIYGQNDTIETISEFFSHLHNKSSFAVLVLVGGTGVGKSYTTEIIKSHLKANILYFFPPLYKKDVTQSMLSICRCNLVILENLKNDDILDAVKFVQNLKQKTQGDCILVLILFNSDSFGIQESDYSLKYTLNLNKSVLNINKKFEESNLNQTLVKYNMITKNDLKKCIKLIAVHHNIVLKDNELDIVSNQLIETGSGCKGAHARLRVAQKQLT